MERFLSILTSLINLLLIKRQFDLSRIRVNNTLFASSNAATDLAYYDPPAVYIHS